jgi:ketosteroid isomerase-like protein
MRPKEILMQWKYAVAIILMMSSASRMLGGQVADAESRRQVIATDDQRMEALRRGDGAPLLEIYMDDYSLVTPAGAIRSKTDQINELASGRLQQRIELLERDVRVYDNVSIVLSRERSDIQLNGQQVGGEMRMTRVYKKFGNQWRVIATHGSFIGQRPLP